MLQMLGIVFLLFGEGIFSAMGMEVPAAYKALQENKMMAIGILFLGNSFAQQLVATGAFEMELNGREIYSKLKEGRMPTIEEIITRLEAAGLETSH